MMMMIMMVMMKYKTNKCHTCVTLIGFMKDGDENYDDAEECEIQIIHMKHV